MTGVGSNRDPQLDVLQAEMAANAERLRRLQRIGMRLATSLTTEQVVEAVMETLQSPHGTSTRVLWLVAPGGTALELRAHTGLQPDAAARFARIPLDSDLPGAVACREHCTVISSSRADAVSRFPELHDAARSANGFIAVPLGIEEEALGVLAFGFSDRLDDADVLFLEAAASHIAQTLRRIRLSDALNRRAEEAMAAAERERRRSEQLELIAAVTHAAITARGHLELMRAVAGTVVPALGDWCSIHFVPEPGLAVETVVVHVDPERQPWAERLAAGFPLDPRAVSGVAAVVATGLTEHRGRLTGATLDDALERGQVAPLEAEVLGEAGDGSVIAVPIRAKRGVIGALRAVRAGPAEHDPGDLLAARAVAGRTGDALDVMWLTEQHRHISVTLQEALLPPLLPQLADLDVSATYLPAGIASDVGGDFYDVYALSADTTALLIGDACGTGPNAAALTSIARHTGRAAARHGHGHREVLEWINQAVKYSDRNLFCTACYATFDRTSRGSITLRFASGGHPLPIHLTGGTATILGGTGTLLGVFDDITTSVHEAELEPGDTVVFYTDGITDLPPPNGRTEHELAAFLGALPPDLTPRQIADAVYDDVARRVPDTERHDDIALLVLRYAPDRPTG